MTLFDQPVTVVGAGGIAIALLRLFEPFRARVTIVRRHAAPLRGAARTVQADGLPSGPLLAARIAENVRRLVTGEELVGRVDPDAGY